MDEFTRKSTAHMDQKLVKQAIKAIDKSPELKKIRSIKDGMQYSEINTGVNDQQYKDNYDKIKWTKDKDKPKPKFKVRVNGKVINDEEE
tara:strand:+ start:2208 stop:2474 length:267 start_codon:yes stop_codon:yes gene_type:complete